LWILSTQQQHKLLAHTGKIMGITNESVFEYCYYEYFVVDAHFDSLLLNKMMMKKKKNIVI